MAKLTLGLDIGGTKLAAGLVNLETRQLINAAYANTPASGGGDMMFQTIIDLAESLAGIDNINRIGVSFGGHVRQDQILRSVQIAGWSGYPLKERLLDHFGSLPCRLANDGNAMALGEWQFGAGQNVDSLLYVLVGTGIGSGLVLDGQILEGAGGMAGEFGHVVAVPNGPLCPCGKRGCLEAVAAGPAIARRAAEILANNSNIQSELRNTTTLTAKLIAEFAHQGDAVAIMALTSSAVHIGTALGNAINLLDIERVVIGGGVSRSGALWWQTLTQAARDAAIPWRGQLDIKRSELGQYEGVWAAASLVT